MAEEQGPVPSRRGVRTLKDLFKSLDKDEDERKEAEKVEEAELGFKPDKEEKASKVLFDKDEAVSDSDGEGSELGGELKADLMNDICGALKEFSNHYGGHTSY